MALTSLDLTEEKKTRLIQDFIKQKQENIQQNVQDGDHDTDGVVDIGQNKTGHDHRQGYAVQNANLVQSVKDKPYRHKSSGANMVEDLFHGKNRKYVAYQDVVGEQKPSLELYSLKHPIRKKYHCVHLHITPPTPVCLYPDEQDVYISKYIQQDGIWEPHLIQQFQDILHSNPGIGVIDIGANIGVYTLVGAMMGHRVIAVEPLEENIKHLHQGALLGNVTANITVLHNAISDRRDMMELSMHRDNQGSATLDIGDQPPPCVTPPCLPPIHTIIMDDLLALNIPFDTALIKIDIEGHEHRAFRRAEKLLSRVFVPYIFMEWVKLRTYFGAEITESTDKDLTFQLIDFLLSQGYSPHSSVTGVKLKPKYWYAWSHDIIWKHALQEFL